MYQTVEAWLNQILDQEIPSGVEAMLFNLYEDGDDTWSLELVGTGSFNPEDPDWGCDEVTNFGTREEPLFWEEEAAWEDILEEITTALTEYLDKGAKADVLTRYQAVAVGFVDGELDILYGP